MMTGLRAVFTPFHAAVAAVDPLRGWWPVPSVENGWWQPGVSLPPVLGRAAAPRGSCRAWRRGTGIGPGGSPGRPRVGCRYAASLGDDRWVVGQHRVGRWIMRRALRMKSGACREFVGRRSGFRPKDWQDRLRAHDRTGKRP